MCGLYVEAGGGNVYTGNDDGFVACRPVSHMHATLCSPRSLQRQPKSTAMGSWCDGWSSSIRVVRSSHGIRQSNEHKCMHVLHAEVKSTPDRLQLSHTKNVRIDSTPSWIHSNYCILITTKVSSLQAMSIMEVWDSDCRL